jgi:hypothetical protein
MGDPLNLRLARKRRNRDKAAADATVNRHRFGRSRAEKQQSAMDEERSARQLEAHRRTPDAPADCKPGR